MIRFRIQELLADKHFTEGRRVTLLELSQATGINRVTLSKMVNQRGYSTVTDNLDKLCQYFNCKLEQLAEFVPDAKDGSSSHGEQ
uniref:HTH cro/C1-type domain-containing protein n=1 Tax=Dechloromonas aromatica (strain RCB) TaxID=159087 RepID=Q47GF9_DECAR